MSILEECTRVYMLSSTRAHLLPPGRGLSTVGGTDPRALCGLSTWPTFWRGARDYGERQQAAAMDLCANCVKRLERLELERAAAKAARGEG